MSGHFNPGEEFKRFLSHVPDDIMPNVWFIPLRKGTKEPDILQGGSLKDPKYRLTPEQAAERIRSGANVGIYAMNGGLLFLDADTEKGNIVLPEEIRKTIPTTLTIKTRNGGLQYYYINNGRFKNKIHTYKGTKAGEIRAEWYYVVAPGSYVKPDEDAGKDAEGVYRIINDASISMLDKLPDGITVKEDKPRKEIEIKTQHTWKNDLGMPLFEIRKKSPKLDTLLKGANESDRSAADMATVQLLYFWRFTDSEIIGILREYRPYEKTARQDYLETTIGNINRGDQYSPSYRKTKSAQREKHTTSNATCSDCLFKPRGGIGGCRNPLNDDENKKKKYVEFDYTICDKFKNPEAPQFKESDKNDEVSISDISMQVMAKYPIISLKDNPDEMYYYENGVYKYGADTKIRAVTQVMLGDETNRHLINEVIFYIQNATFINREEINKDKYLINFKNGLYNLHTKQLEPHGSNILSTCQIPVEYDPKATCPEISNFLCEILRPRDIALMLQTIGYCLIPDYSIQKAFLWNGSGLNGKGTLARLIIALIGTKNKSSESLQVLNNDKFASANLFGKLVNIDTDLTDAAVNEDTVFKKLTGWDMIPAERKFQIDLSS